MKNNKIVRSTGKLVEISIDRPVETSNNSKVQDFQERLEDPDFSECFQDLLLEICEDTYFRFSTSYAQIAGLEATVESLTDWAPNWWISINVSHWRHLAPADLQKNLSHHLDKLAAAQDYPHNIELEFIYHWSSWNVFIELRFEKEIVS